MAANRIYLQLDFGTAQAQDNVQKFNKELKNMGKNAEDAGKQGSAGLKNLTVSMEQTTNAVGNLVTSLAGLAIGRFIADLVHTGDMFNRVEIAIRAMTGSADQAEKTMKGLMEVAAHSPFPMQDITEAGRRLIAFGFDAKNAADYVGAITRAIKTVGGTSEDVELLTQALGVMAEKGVAQAQQLFRQIAAQGIPAMEIIRQKLLQETGKLFTDTEIREKMEKGLLLGRQTALALLEGMKQIPDATKEMMNQATSQFQQLKNEATKLASELSTALQPQLDKLLQWAKDWVDSMKDDPARVDRIAQWLQWSAIIAGTVIGLKAVVGLFKSLVQLAKDLRAVKLFEEFMQLPKVQIMLETLLPIIKGIGGALSTWGIAAGGAMVATGVQLDALRQKSEDFEDSLIRQAIASGKSVKDLEALGYTAERIAKAFNNAKQQIKREPYDIKTGTGIILPQNMVRGPNILGLPEKLLQAQIDESEAIYARAQEELYKGFGAIRAKYQHEFEKNAKQAEMEVPEWVKVNPWAATNLYKAQALEIERVKKDMVAKDREETLKIRAEDLKTRIEDIKTTGAIEADLAQVTIKDTLAAEAASEIKRLDIRLKTAEDIRQVAQQEAANQLEIKQAELIREGEITLAGAKKNSGDYWLILADLTARDERLRAEARDATQKADIAAARETQEAILEIIKKATDETTELRKQARDILENEQVASAERQIRIARMTFETGEAQTARQKIASIQQASEFEIQAAEYVAKTKSDLARKHAVEEYNKRVAEQQKFAELADLADQDVDNLRAVNRNKEADDMQKKAEDFKAAARKMGLDAQAIWDVFYAQDAVAFSELQDLKVEIALDANKRINQAWIDEQKQIFDKFKNLADQMLDSLFQHGKGFWARMRDMAFNMAKDFAKAALAPMMAAAMMNAFGMPVQLERPDFGGGQFAGIMSLMQQRPVFGPPPNKANLPGHINDLKLLPDGSVSVTPKQPPGPKPQFDATITHNLNIRSSGGGAAALAAAAGAGGGGGGGGDRPDVQSLLRFYGVDTGATEIPPIVGSVTRTEALAGGGFSLGSATLGFGGDGLPLSTGYAQTLLGPMQASASTINTIKQATSIWSFIKGFGLGGGAVTAATSAVARGADVSALMEPIAGGATLSLPSSALGLGIKAPFAYSGLATAAAPFALGGAIGGLSGAFGLGRYAQRSGNPLAAIGAPLLGAFSGLLAAGSLAALFPSIFVPLLAAGPIGWIVAGAIGASIGLMGLLKESDTTHARKLIKQMYGIDINNISVLRQVVQIAKQKYGGAISLAVASPEVQQLINLYAASQGAGAVGPRPMYPSLYTQTGGALTLQPQYSNGQVVASPYAGTTTTQYANWLAYNQQQPTSMYIQLDPNLARDLFAGQVVDVLNSNPTVVGNANSMAINSGSSRMAQLGGLMEPLTVPS